MPSYKSFKENNVKFIKPLFQWYNPERIKRLSQLYLNFRHLRDQRFKRSFQGTNRHCTCVLETTSYFILLCFYSENEGHILFASICDITTVRDPSLLTFLVISKAIFWNETNLTLSKHFFTEMNLSEAQNDDILNATAKYLMLFVHF